jgi:hypothetical protein
MGCTTDSFVLNDRPIGADMTIQLHVSDITLLHSRIVCKFCGKYYD